MDPYSGTRRRSHDPPSTPVVVAPWVIDALRRRLGWPTAFHDLACKCRGCGAAVWPGGYEADGQRVVRPLTEGCPACGLISEVEPEPAAVVKSVRKAMQTEDDPFEGLTMGAPDR